MALLTITTICLVLFNLIMWIIFALKFRRIFSTDDAKKEIDDLKKSMYKACGRNLDLVEDKIKQLKSVTAEAERKIAMYREQLSAAKGMAFQNVIDAETRKYREKSSRSQRKVLQDDDNTELFQDELFSSEADTDVDVPVSYIAGRYKRNASPKKAPERKDETLVKKIPVIPTQFYLSENPIQVKKSFKQQVAELHGKGFTDEEIATELGRSVQEVKFTLALT
ncbi:MAG: hypothetical protein J6Z17_04860 [Treponema sp.]|nr:hypothetical protein [Treponema sp.]